MAYNFYLDGVQLPIAPPKLQVKIKNQNKTITLINEGEVNVLKKAGLTEILMDVRIPQTKYPFASYSGGFKVAEYYLNHFEKLKTQKDKDGNLIPFQFICSRFSPNGKMLFDTNIKVSLEDYQLGENAEDGFDLIVTVNMKQYRDYGTKTVKITPPPTPEAKPVAQPVQERPAPTAPQVKTYTVVSGDCLWNIAKRFLGNGARYTEIYNLNKDKIKNPNLIYPNQILILP